MFLVEQSTLLSHRDTDFQGHNVVIVTDNDSFSVEQVRALLELSSRRTTNKITITNQLSTNTELLVSIGIAIGSGEHIIAIGDIHGLDAFSAHIKPYNKADEIPPCHNDASILAEGDSTSSTVLDQEEDKESQDAEENKEASEPKPFIPVTTLTPEEEEIMAQIKFSLPKTKRGRKAKPKPEKTQVGKTKITVKQSARQSQAKPGTLNPGVKPAKGGVKLNSLGVPYPMSEEEIAAASNMSQEELKAKILTCFKGEDDIYEVKKFFDATFPAQEELWRTTVLPRAEEFFKEANPS